MVKGQRTIDVARVTQNRTDCRAPECQCWRGFPGNARITRHFEKTFIRSCQAGSTGTLGRHKKVFEICCASVRFAPISCPARVSGERHAVHFCTLPCGLFQRATVRAAHHHTPQGTPKRPTGGEIGHHWTAVSALPRLGLPEWNPSKCMGNAIYGIHSSRLYGTSVHKPSTICCPIRLQHNTYGEENHANSFRNI